MALSDSSEAVAISIPVVPTVAAPLPQPERPQEFDNLLKQINDERQVSGLAGAARPEKLWEAASQLERTEIIRFLDDLGESSRAGVKKILSRLITHDRLGGSVSTSANS